MRLGFPARLSCGHAGHAGYTGKSSAEVLGRNSRGFAPLADAAPAVRVNLSRWERSSGGPDLGRDLHMSSGSNQSPAIGIDLGTTFSVIARLDDLVLDREGSGERACLLAHGAVALLEQRLGARDCTVPLTQRHGSRWRKP